MYILAMGIVCAKKLICSLPIYNMFLGLKTGGSKQPYIASLINSHDCPEASKLHSSKKGLPMTFRPQRVSIVYKILELDKLPRPMAVQYVYFYPRLLISLL